MKAVWKTAWIVFGLMILSARAALAQSEIGIGHQLMYNPGKVAIADGGIERATGRTIEWRRFDSGAKVINAIASGAVQAALSGSSPIAAGISHLTRVLYEMVIHSTSNCRFVMGQALRETPDYPRSGATASDPGRRLF